MASLNTGEIVSIILGSLLFITLVLGFYYWRKSMRTVRYLDTTPRGIVESFNRLSPATKQETLKRIVNAVDSEGRHAEQMLNDIGRDINVDDLPTRTPGSVRMPNGMNYENKSRFMMPNDSVNRSRTSFEKRESERNMSNKRFMDNENFEEENMSGEERDSGFLGLGGNESVNSDDFFSTEDDYESE